MSNNNDSSHRSSRASDTDEDETPQATCSSSRSSKSVSRSITGPQLTSSKALKRSRLMSSTNLQSSLPRSSRSVSRSTSRPHIISYKVQKRLLASGNWPSTSSSVDAHSQVAWSSRDQTNLNNNR